MGKCPLALCVILVLGLANFRGLTDDEDPVWHETRLSPGCSLLRKGLFFLSYFLLLLASHFEKRGLFMGQKAKQASKLKPRRESEMPGENTLLQFLILAGEDDVISQLWGCLQLSHPWHTLSDLCTLTASFQATLSTVSTETPHLAPCPACNYSPS
jgi:hypothetical protein